MSRPIQDDEVAALKILARRGRIVAVLVPDGVPDGFVASVSAWVNFLLDTRLTPPLVLPATRQGDGLVCPYCNVAATARPDGHDPSCPWRRAIMRWGEAQLQIERDFPES